MKYIPLGLDGPPSNICSRQMGNGTYDWLREQRHLAQYWLLWWLSRAAGYPLKINLGEKFLLWDHPLVVGNSTL